MVLELLVVREQAFRLRANAPRDKRGLRGKRGGRVSKSIAGPTCLKISNYALTPLVTKETTETRESREILE